MTLVGLMWIHRPALEYDLRTRVGFGVDDIACGAVTWRVAWDITSEILRDPYSHVCAAIAGWAYVPNPVDVQFLNWVDATAQMHHQAGKVRPRPAERPWTKVPPKAPAPATPDRLKRRATLRDRLGLTQ